LSAIPRVEPGGSGECKHELIRAEPGALRAPIELYIGFMGAEES